MIKKRNNSSETNVNGSIIDLYFSDHDAVKFIFTHRNK